MTGCAIHLYAANRSMTDRYLLRRRRRAPDRAAAGAAAHRHRARPPRRRAARDRRDPARRALRASSCPTATARGYVCENYGAPFRLPDLGVDRQQRPRQSARLRDAGRVVRGSRGRLRARRQVRRATCGARAIDHSPLDVVAWHGNHAPYKYDLQALQRDRLDQLRPSRPVDLPRAAVAERHARRGHDRLRRSSRRASSRWSTRSVRRGSIATSRREFMGLIAGRLRREGGRLPAGRREPAQLHVRARARRGHVREGERGRHVEADASSATRWRSCSRRGCRSCRRAQRSSRRSCSTSTTAAGRG